MRAKRFNKKGKVFFAVACHLMCQPPLNQRVERGGELAVGFGQFTLTMSARYSVFPVETRFGVADSIMVCC